MSTAEISADHGISDSQSPAEAFTSVLNAAVGSAAAKLDRKATTWTDQLNDIAGGQDTSAALTEMADEGLDEVADSGGVKTKAGAEGVRATLQGKNPIWAAIKGAWQASSPAVKAAIIASVVSVILLLLLSPVLSIVFLLSLLIIAAVHRARAAGK